MNNAPVSAIAEALKLLPPKLTTRGAWVELLTIGAQESEDWQYRRQKGNGPARGFWQFEMNGGVKGVMLHPSKTVRDLAQQVCLARNTPWDREVIWQNLERDDVLAAAFARLNLYGDPGALPAVGDEQGAWDMYARVWRPGKPHRDTWGARYKAAVAATVQL